MKRIIVILSISALGLGGCNDNQYEKGEGNLLYKIHKDQSGETIMEDDFVGLTYTERTEEDSVTYNTKDFDGRTALMFRQRSSFKGDFFTAIGMLSEGDSATFKINLDSIVVREKRARPNTKGKYLIYNVMVNKVVARGERTDDQYNIAIEAYRASELELAKSLEKSKITNYLSSLKSKPAKTASGLRYVMSEKGEGRTAEFGDTIEVHYAVRYLSGKLVETSSAAAAAKDNAFNKLFPYQPVKIVVKKGEYLSGFKESLLILPKGTKARLIIPSGLAYANEGYLGIRAYTAILCDVEIIDIIHPKP